MNYYANDEERVRLIAGLRDLANFLDQNPDVPVHGGPTCSFSRPRRATRRCSPKSTRIAELIGSAASDADSPHGHYSAVRNFGPVHYRAVAIPHSARNKGGE